MGTTVDNVFVERLAQKILQLDKYAVVTFNSLTLGLVVRTTDIEGVRQILCAENTGYLKEIEVRENVHLDRCF